MHATHVVGYDFQAQRWCYECVLEAVIQSMPNDIRARFEMDDDAGVSLGTFARFMGIDREREDTYDSDEFPKVVWSESLEPGERCAGCGEPLVDDGKQDYAVAVVFHIRATNEAGAYAEAARLAHRLDLDYEDEDPNPIEITSALFSSNAYAIERSAIENPDFDLELWSHGKRLRPERSET